MHNNSPYIKDIGVLQLKTNQIERLEVVKDNMLDIQHQFKFHVEQRLLQSDSIETIKRVADTLGINDVISFLPDLIPVHTDYNVLTNLKLSIEKINILLTAHDTQKLTNESSDIIKEIIYGIKINTEPSRLSPKLIALIHEQDNNIVLDMHNFIQIVLDNNDHEVLLSIPELKTFLNNYLQYENAYNSLIETFDNIPVTYSNNIVDIINTMYTKRGLIDITTVKNRIKDAYAFTYEQLESITVNEEHQIVITTRHIPVEHAHLILVQVTRILRMIAAVATLETNSKIIYHNPIDLINYYISIEYDTNKSFIKNIVASSFEHIILATEKSIRERMVATQEGMIEIAREEITNRLKEYNINSMETTSNKNIVSEDGTVTISYPSTDITLVVFQNAVAPVMNTINRIYKLGTTKNIIHFNGVLLELLEKCFLDELGVSINTFIEKCLTNAVLKPVPTSNRILKGLLDDVMAETSNEHKKFERNPLSKGKRKPEYNPHAIAKLRKEEALAEIERLKERQALRRKHKKT